jgi:phosphotransacetylase
MVETREAKEACRKFIENFGAEGKLAYMAASDEGTPVKLTSEAASALLRELAKKAFRWLGPGAVAIAFFPKGGDS